MKLFAWTCKINAEIQKFNKNYKLSDYGKIMPSHIVTIICYIKKNCHLASVL